MAGSRALRVLLSIVTAGAVVALPTTASAAPPPTGGTVIVDETFSGATVPDPAWKIDGTTCLTGAASGATPPAGAAQIPACQNHRSGPVPPMGTVPGYLQLTDTAGFVAGDILYQRPIPSTAGLSVVFEQYQYGGNEADGIGFFLVDGATTASSVGGNGGSLGYAPRSGQPGVPGGYIGVGLDAYGNFYDDGEGRGANCPEGQRSPAGSATGRIAPNVITLRGPGNGLNGYCWLAATTTNDGTHPTSTLPGSLRGPAGTTTPPPAKRLVNVQITPAPNPRVIVQMDFTGTGTSWVEVLNVAAPSPVPSTYKFGFLASTGGNNDVHLLRNVVVRTIDELDNLQLTKQISRAGAALPPVITAGTKIPYEYVVTNAGNETLTNVNVADDKVTGISCPFTTLPPEPDPAGTVVCTGTYTVTAADVTAGSIVNHATAHGTPPAGPVVDSNPATVTLPLVSSLSITKSVTTPAPYFVGQVVTYGYVVTNTGGTVVQQLAVTDNRVGSGKVVCANNSLDPGATTNCTGTYTVQSGALTPAGLLVNTASAQGFTTLGQNVQSGQAQATINVAADIAVTKTVSNSTPTVGDSVTFTVTVRNNGPGLGAGVVVADPVPPGLTFQSATPSAGTYTSSDGRWVLPPLAVNQSETLQLTVRVDTAAAVVNGATVAAALQPDPDLTNNTASAGINPVTPTVDIAVTKTASQAEIRVGHTVTFTVTATNHGPFPATGVQLTDPLPSLLGFVSASATQGSYSVVTARWNVGSLAVNQSEQLTLVATALGTGTTTNTAGLAAVTPEDINSLNDVDSATVVITPPLADLVVTKTVSPDPVQTGDDVMYTVTAYNIGPDPALNPVVRDFGPVPDGLEIVSATASQGTFDQDALTWMVGRLDPGQEAAVLTVIVHVLTPGTKANAVVIRDDSVDDPVTENNHAVATFTGNLPPLDIAVGKSATPTTVDLNNTSIFTITAENLGPNNATGLTLQDELPPGFAFVSSSGDGVYDSATGLWTVGSLPDGSTAALSITARAVQAGGWTNIASLRSLDQADTNNANNSAAVRLDVIEEADVEITKAVAPAVAKLGDIVTYTVTVANNGPNDTTDVIAVDPVKQPAEILSVTASQGTFDAVQREWTVGDLDAGQSETLTVEIRITYGGTIVNTVQITQSKLPDPNLLNNTAHATLSVPLADVAVTKRVQPTSLSIGQTAVFTIEVTNNGPDTAAAVVVSDPLPDGLAVVSAQPSAGTYADGIWTVGDLLPGDKQTLDLTVTAVAAGTKKNTATANASAPPDPNPSNNTASATVAVASPSPSRSGSPSASPTGGPMPPTGQTRPSWALLLGAGSLLLGLLLLVVGRRIRVTSGSWTQ